MARASFNLAWQKFDSALIPRHRRRRSSHWTWPARPQKSLAACGRSIDRIEAKFTLGGNARRWRTTIPPRVSCMKLRREARPVSIMPLAIAAGRPASSRKSDRANLVAGESFTVRVEALQSRQYFRRGIFATPHARSAHRVEFWPRPTKDQKTIHGRFKSRFPADAKPFPHTSGPIGCFLFLLRSCKPVCIPPSMATDF